MPLPAGPRRDRERSRAAYPDDLGLRPRHGLVNEAVRSEEADGVFRDEDVGGKDESLTRISLNDLNIVRKIVFPAVLPGSPASARITASISIILLVAAEMIGAEYAIGACVLLAGNLMATDQLVAGIAILSALGLLVNWLISCIEKRFLAWRN